MNEPKIRKRINIVMFILVIVVMVIIGIIGHNERNKVPHLITFKELQQELVDRGYDIVVDGRIGKATIKAWDMELCNQEAIKEFEK